MASVPLRFIAPADPDMEQLQVFESDAPDGTFNLIDTVTEIGTYPEYITEYTTANATSATNWFAIKWIDTKGASTDLSASVQGGTESLVSYISSRIMLLDPSINESVLLQQAEDVVGQYFNTEDPLLVTPSQATSRQKSGLTFLTMARYRLLSLSNATASWTAGLVSMKSADTTETLKAINEMVKQAERMLGLGYSVVAQMVLPEIVGGLSQIVSADISRLQIEVE